MIEKHVWKVTFRTNEVDTEGDELCEHRNVIADDFESAYGWAKKNVEFDEGSEDGFTGIVTIACISDLIEVV
jgi:hypothetical protein